jgi:hypothetical protein
MSELAGYLYLLLGIRRWRQKYMLKSCFQPSIQRRAKFELTV